eukprot:1159976-Pelagomonas_calceolata.AAC.7
MGMGSPKQLCVGKKLDFNQHGKTSSSAAYENCERGLLCCLASCAPAVVVNNYLARKRKYLVSAR